MTTTAYLTKPARPELTYSPVRAHHRTGWHDAAALAALGRSVADHGLAVHRDEIASLALAASSTAPVAAHVLADTDEPDVARLRALAVVSAALTTHPAPWDMPAGETA